MRLYRLVKEKKEVTGMKTVNWKEFVREARDRFGNFVEIRFRCPVCNNQQIYDDHQLAHHQCSKCGVEATQVENNLQIVTYGNDVWKVFHFSGGKQDG